MAEQLSAHSSRYQGLRADKIIATIDQLSLRIYERFPESSLYGVSQHLHAISHKTKEQAETIGRPIIWLRVVSSLVVVLIVGGVTMALISALTIVVPEDGFVFTDFVQAVEAVINDIILLGAGIFFMVTIETRIRRRRALRALHELRSIAHIIDMHQLTKDPERVMGQRVRTPSSPTTEMTPYELSRYLDYCSELLSLIGKLAALYMEHLDDPVVHSAVNDIETLTTGLARKIWQKIMIVYQMMS